MKSGLVRTHQSLENALEYLTWHDIAPYRYWLGSKRGKNRGLNAVSLEIQFVGDNPKPVSETESKLRARIASLSMPSSSNLKSLNSIEIRQIPWGDLIASHSTMLSEGIRSDQSQVKNIKSKVRRSSEPQDRDNMRITGANNRDSILIAKVYADLCFISPVMVAQRTADALGIKKELVTMALRIARRNKWLTSLGTGKSGGVLTELGKSEFSLSNGNYRENILLTKVKK